MKNFGVCMVKGSNGGVSEVKKFYWEHQFVNGVEKNENSGTFQLWKGENKAHAFVNGVEKNFGNTNHILK